MFALIRHAEYDIGSGLLTDRGREDAHTLVRQLVDTRSQWQDIRTSPVSRCRETASILGQGLNLSVIDDGRLAMDGNNVDLLPPTEPHGCIFVSHLPVLTGMLRLWSKRFHQQEPPLTKESSGYVIDPERKMITPIGVIVV